MATASSSAHAAASHSVPCHYGEGDLIYIFLLGHLHRFVYNMKDGTMAPFAADIPEDKLGEADGKVMNSTLLFPPE